MKVIVALTALALLVVPAGRAGPPPPQLVCAPLFSELLGDYFRYDDRAWELTFNEDCTYRARQHGTEEGGGNYTMTEHGIDAPIGVVVFSNDRGCQQPDLQDQPTPYEFSYLGGRLMLAPQSTDLCVNTKGEGRPRELSGHGGWVKAVAGKVTISIDTRFFKVKGAITDNGTVRVLHSKVRKGVRTSSLRFTGAKGTFSVSERIEKGKARWSLHGRGAGGYRYLAGGGNGTTHDTRQSLRGDVSN